MNHVSSAKSCFLEAEFPDHYYYGYNEENPPTYKKYCQEDAALMQTITSDRKYDKVSAGARME